MLKLTISVNHDIDISRFKRLIAFLKRKHERHEPKQARVFKPEEVKKFLKTADDKQYLLEKVRI